MKSTGSWRVWAVLAICAALVLGAMTWLTRNVIGSERERAVAEARADLQERMRLSLWRMDSAGTALIVEESQRPVGLASNALPIPPDSPVKMRFELSDRSSLSSNEGEEHLGELRALLGRDGGERAAFSNACQSLHTSNNVWAANLQDPPQQAAEQNLYASPRSIPQQDYNNVKERAVRGKAVDAQITKNSQVATKEEQAIQQIPFQPQMPAQRILRDVGPPRPSWIGSELFLLRRVVWEKNAARPDGASIEGVWIDSKKLKASLLEEIRDLLPAATLVPATAFGSDGMVLASFPWRLQAGVVPLVEPGISRPILISLTAGWIAALLAILAASILVRAIMRLSERRASFVSAVTHELRTPLTTFRLYSDMLEAGAVKEEKRSDYLRVLSREADRLSHLVENVLAFSRIERGSARAAVRQTSAKEMLEPMRERFVSRLGSVGLQLEMPLTESAAGYPLKVDAAAVEHVLFNLIDNAAKYASSSNPPLVEMEIGKTARGIAIRVIDHGPGVSVAERKRIFRAFHKSALDAAETRPGVGLGLALSRRLARSLGGDLQYEAQDKGAGFVLTLPAG